MWERGRRAGRCIGTSSGRLRAGELGAGAGPLWPGRARNGTAPTSGAELSGSLHLATLDSAAKAASAGGAVRDLIGWLDLTGGDSIWQRVVGSRDAARPGAVLAGQHLRLGRSEYPDGVSHHLTITAVSSNGFWGWWKADRGIAVTTEPNTRRLVPDPAGYFCALRRPRSLH